MGIVSFRAQILISVFPLSLLSRFVLSFVFNVLGNVTWHLVIGDEGVFCSFGLEVTMCPLTSVSDNMVSTAEKSIRGLWLIHI